MIKKRIYYLVVNGSDDPPVMMEAYDLLNAEEMRLWVAHELRSPLAYVRIMSQRDQFLSIFSILDFIANQDVSFTLRNFDAFVNEVQRYIQAIPTHELFWIWLSQFDSSVIVQDRSIALDILQKYQFAFSYDDLETLRRDWDVQLQERTENTQERYQRTIHVYEHLFEHQCDTKDILPFAIRKTRVKFQLQYEHSLYYMMDRLRLHSDWRIAMYKDLVRSHASMSTSLLEEYDESYMATLQERIEERGDEGEVDALVILHRDLEQVIRIQSVSPTSPFSYEVVMDVIPFDDIDPMRKIVSDMIGSEPSRQYETISISGTFYLKHVVFQKLVLQDFLMNDAIASHIMYVNELEKAYRHGENVTVHFGNQLTAILMNRQNDTSPLPSTLSYFQGNYVKVNVLRATGSQQNTNVVSRFQEILCAILQRFMRHYNEYQELYYTILPNTPTFPTLTSDEPVQEIRNFADKYKNIFKHTGYKTSCRPKTRMPSIITEQEARTLNPLKVIKFPKPDDSKLDIPPEYLTCDDPAYPFPGIASLGGGDLFVPCCFNKNPRSSRAFVEYYQGVKTTEPKGTEHVKSESQIIKSFGDVGRLPSPLHQFMVALFPNATFLRAGTMDSPCSILHSLSYMMGKSDVPVSDATARQAFASHFGRNLEVCQAENVGMSLQEIQRNLKDSTQPLDPRRYFRLLEIFYQANIIIFVRTKKREDFEILNPHYRHFYLRYDFDPSKPFVFLYEHWGTSPDRYTKRLHPVYEMIVSPIQGVERPNTLFELDRTQTSILSKIYRTLFFVYPMGQNVPILRVSKQVRAQLLDDQGKLRTLIVEQKNASNEYFGMECMHPLPAIFISDPISFTSQDVQAILEKLPTIDQVVNASPFPRMNITKYLRYRQRFYIVISNGTYHFKVAVRFIPNEQQSLIQRSGAPVITSVPSPLYPPSIDLVRKQQLARALMDYVLYMYASFYHDDKKDASYNDDYPSFFQTHTMIVPDYEYPKVMSERVDENPLIMEASTRTLILDSQRLQEKLTFVLKYHRMYDSPSLASYRNVRILPSFWKSPYDFESWKDIQSITNFEKYVRMGHRLPYDVDRIPLSQLSKSQGYWYHYDERPIRSWTCPFRYVRVETSDDVVPLTLYWRKYRTIPSYRVTDPVSSIERVRVMTYQEATGWTPTPDTIDVPEDEPVFEVRNANGQIFVLLEMKN